MKVIMFLFSLAFSYLLGFILNKGLSVINEIKGNDTYEHTILYLYTIGINEILWIIILTMIFYLCLCLFYRASKVSVNQLLAIEAKTLWIELIIFLFIIGTWFESELKESEHLKLKIISSETILILLLIVLLKIVTVSIFTLPENEKKAKESDLYISRKKLLPIIESYLSSSSGFSIVGDWGIGKSKLIENFFKTEKNEKGKYYKEKYELIYIDVSKYSNNKKIVQELEIKLNKVLFKYKILKINEKITESLFDNSIGWLRKIQECIFLENCLTDSNYTLKEKILELKKLDKEIVICLDNLERIDDKNRITNLLAVVDDLIINEIKKIYVYDEQYMISIFRPTAFSEYIDKYSCHTIRVENVQVKEIIKNPEIIESLKSKLLNRINEASKEKSKEEEEISELIKKKLSNPRNIINTIRYIENRKNKFSEENQLEYKILIDLFGKIDLNNKFQKLLFFPNMTYDERVKLEIFQAISNGDNELINIKAQNELKKISKNAFLGNGGDILSYIRYCEKNLMPEKISELFKEVTRYEIDNEGDLYDFIKIMYKGIDIKINKLFLLKKPNFFGSSENYDLEYTKYLLKVILIRKKLINFKLLSRVIFNNLLDYENIYKNPPESFEKELENIKKLNLNEFIEKLKKISLNRKYSKIINYNLLAKEFELLDRISYMEEKEEFKKIRLEKEIFENYIKNNTPVKQILNISQDNIKLELKDQEIFRIIDEGNVEEYKNEFLGLVEEGELIKNILMEIYFLERRIKHSKIKKIRPNIDKFKKYYKNN